MADSDKVGVFGLDLGSATQGASDQAPDLTQQATQQQQVLDADTGVRAGDDTDDFMTEDEKEQHLNAKGVVDIQNEDGLIDRDIPIADQPTNVTPRIGDVKLEGDVRGQADPRLAQELQAREELAFNLRKAAVLDEAALYEIEADELDDFANVVERDVEEAEQIMSSAKQKGKEIFEQMNATMKVIQSGQVDPNRFYTSRGAASAFSAAINVAVGQITSALGAGPNAAAQIIEAAVNRDIAAQEFNSNQALQQFGAQQTLLSTLRQLTGDELAAQQSLRALKYAEVTTRLEAAAARAKSPQVRRQLLETINNLKVSQIQAAQASNTRVIAKASITGKNASQEKFGRMVDTFNQLGIDVGTGLPTESAQTQQGLQVRDRGGKKPQIKRSSNETRLARKIESDEQKKTKLFTGHFLDSTDLGGWPLKQPININNTNNQLRFNEDDVIKRNNPNHKKGNADIFLKASEARRDIRSAGVAAVGTIRLLSDIERTVQEIAADPNSSAVMASGAAAGGSLESLVKLASKDTKIAKLVSLLKEQDLNSLQAYKGIEGGQMTDKDRAFALSIQGLARERIVQLFTSGGSKKAFSTSIAELQRRARDRFVSTLQVAGIGSDVTNSIKVQDAFRIR